MRSDYDAIRAQNREGYGTYIRRTGPMLLANRYDDRTHFIFELLQNAEDALRRRSDWNGSRSVRFALEKTSLEVSHSGQPFDAQDVRGICGIGESTKDLTSIGRFGIGFKSVFAFTDRPEIHSGAEDFAIEDFVLPMAANQVARSPEETIIRIPLRPEDLEAHDDAARGLEGISPLALLFLRQIDEIEWSVDAGRSGP
jgi:hypothetical protein